MLDACGQKGELYRPEPPAPPRAAELSSPGQTMPHTPMDQGLHQDRSR
ncbi:hypothetical protein [Caldichromatium japonicum]|nr:hypothetical protein [Caldichromatium japonicum]